MHDYLDKLARMLEKFAITDEEKEDILDDYRQMIDDGVDKGMTDEEIIARIGTVDAVEKGLRSTYKLKQSNRKNSHKVIAVMPFVAVLLFFLGGFVFDAWHVSWMAFLLIPLSAVLVDGWNRKRGFPLTAASPFLAVITFMVLGFALDAWHPGWLVFLIIPMSGILESSRQSGVTIGMLAGLSVFVGVIAFILIGYATGVYVPTWLVLLLPIPIGLLEKKVSEYKALLLTSFFVSIALYLVLGFYVTTWVIALVGFAPFLFVGLMTGNITIITYQGKHSFLLKIVFVLSAIAFIVVGALYSAFVVSWLFLLITPMLAIVLQPGRRLMTELSPFVALLIFFLTGYFLDAWAIAWLAFLMIPVVAILEE